MNYTRLTKRCDILAYDKELNPIVMVECKAPEVKISPSVFDQIAVYNLVFKVKYLIVTNGMNHYCAKVDFEKEKVIFLTEIPNYGELRG